MAANTPDLLGSFAGEVLAGALVPSGDVMTLIFKSGRALRIADGALTYWEVNQNEVQADLAARADELRTHIDELESVLKLAGQ